MIYKADNEYIYMRQANGHYRRIAKIEDVMLARAMLRLANAFSALENVYMDLAENLYPYTNAWRSQEKINPNDIIDEHD